MNKYISPLQSIQAKIKRHRAFICYLVIAIIAVLLILLMLFLGLVIYRDLSTWLDYTYPLSRGWVLFYILIWLICMTVYFTFNLIQICLFWASYRLQGYSAGIIVLMNQPQTSAIAGTPIGSS